MEMSFSKISKPTDFSTNKLRSETPPTYIQGFQPSGSLISVSRQFMKNIKGTGREKRIFQSRG